MKCPICTDQMEAFCNVQVLGKYPARYEVCNGCGFLQAHEPYWLAEAYSRAVAATDTGLVMRNITLAYKLARVLYWIIGERGEGRYLDAAGGYGMLTRLMRDLGFGFYWSDKYCDNLLASGFEYSEAIGACRAVTAIEVFEHLTNPVAFVEEILALSGATAMIFTTELYEGPPPQPDAWWYYTFATGQHIGFFQRRTLEALGKRLGLQFASANGIHIFSKTKVNEPLFRAVTGRWTSLIAPWWIRQRLGSKTVEDHQLMLKRIQ